MNLLALAELWEEAIGSTAVTFNQERCLYAMGKFTTCTACQTVCPVDAIQFGTPPAFSGELCQQCRACLPVCPTGAYTAVDEANTLLTCTERLGTQSCEIVCGLNPNIETGDAAAATAVRIRGCLAGLGVGAYLGLASQGLKKVVVRLDACADCPWQTLRPQVESQVAQARGLLAMWGQAETVVCVDEVRDDFRKRPFYKASSPPLSRRDIFRWRDAEKKAAEPDAAKTTTAYHERLRLLRAIKQMPPPSEPGQATSLAGLGFALMTVSDECTACGTCARACPTGALHMEMTESSYQLTFSPQICIACDICTHVCAPKAIALMYDPAFDQIFETAVEQIVQQGSLTRCSSCRTPFAAQSGTKLCPVCEFRRQNPFGSLLPPELAANQTQKKSTEPGETRRDY